MLPIITKIILTRLRIVSTYILRNVTYKLYVIMSGNFYKQLGQNIRKYRKHLGITQQELADRLGISLNFMGKIEVAFSKPSLETLIKIAEGLNITVSELCNFDEKTDGN